MSDPRGFTIGDYVWFRSCGKGPQIAAQIASRGRNAVGYCWRLYAVEDTARLSPHNAVDFELRLMTPMEVLAFFASEWRQFD